ncbi:phage portal protein [Listeria seeligeri]|uniref:XkdQ/YqbQ family protein n=1 Tax=Listeria TaxID=1637 RepID=UPI0016264332|nr:MULTISPECIES: phage portal protein [Listeria]MBC1532051.1 phage portal protein [Listeria seeligeri]MBC1827136.1 phage portal protein [Listeria seeligeri]MBC1840072.1 phage portal protein [Listeria seeligeri]MBC6141924.1 phage portal protein [Listeria seeligeri]MBC6302453.1 phage portal protein [Listeria immobilis]
MIEVFLITSEYWISLPVQEVTLSGKRYQAPRKLDFKLFYPYGSDHQRQNVEEGNTILFRWKGKELFRGTVFARNITKDAVISITAYDKMQYLLLNKDVYVFNNKRLDQIVARLLSDFSLSKGTITNTGYIIKSLIFSNVTTLYDIILKAISETYKQSGRTYRIYAKAGKLYLEKWNEPATMFLLEDTNTVTDFTVNFSIEEIATKVKVILTKDKKTLYGYASDSSGRNKYGLIQYAEASSDNLNQAQLNKRASQILNQKKGRKKEVTIDALGDPEIVSGMAIQVNLKRISINQKFYVDSDTHTFKGNLHTMSLTLVEQNKIPEVQ